LPSRPNPITTFLTPGGPVVSGDAPQTGLVGAFKHGGRAWQPPGPPADGNVHDFPDPQLGQAIPQQELDKALFWQSLHATILNSAMVLYECLTVPDVQEDARESLNLQLTRAAQTAFGNRVTALAQCVA
jgi:hypothetical protein